MISLNCLSYSQCVTAYDVCLFVSAVSSPFSECCRHDEQTPKQDGDAISGCRKKRTSGDMERRPNKCFRAGDVSVSDDDAAVPATDDDVEQDGEKAGINGLNRDDIGRLAAVRQSVDNVQMTSGVQSDVIDTDAPAQEIDQLYHQPVDDVTIMSSELPVPVTSPTLCSEIERFSGSPHSDVTTTVDTCCYDKYANDVDNMTSLKLLPVASWTNKATCSGTTTFVSPDTSTVGSVYLVPRLLPTPAGVGRGLHSSAGLFPFPVRMTTCHHGGPFVIGTSPAVTLSPSVLPLSTPRWLSISRVAPNLHCASLRLVSPTVIPADYFRKQHVTGCRGRGYCVATLGNCGHGSRFRVCAAFQPNSTEVSDAFQPSHSSPVDPRQSTQTSDSPDQVPAGCNPAASSDDVIAKLDPVSRAVYDNFLGRLRATTKPKTRTARGRSHAINIFRRYRN